VYALRAVAVTLVAMSFAAPAGAASGSHSFPTFFTPGKLAFCKFHTNIAGVKGFTPYLTCWRPRDGFTVTLEPRARPLFGTLAANRGPVESLLLRQMFLHFGETWWGNRVGAQGRGNGKGRVLFRCTSWRSGLTCRSISGHGFWLGRSLGYHIF
jgi:hypothetical protein